MQIFNAQVKAQADAMAAAQDSSATSGSAGSSSSAGGTSEATITANDFLTLLVTEMQNQDPTANTDPNEYINQLVQVNNLQQLISINQEVGVLDPSSGGSSASTTGASSASLPGVALPVAANSAGKQEVKQAAAQVASAGLNASPAQAMKNFAATLHGAPAASPSKEAMMAASARRVASAL